jgi:hypothetical protein
MAEGCAMDMKLTHTQMEERLAVVWSLVLVQGGILVVSTIESFVVNATQGFALIGITILTGFGAALALTSARGLRRLKRWARRLTLVAEWFVLTVGVIELIATQFLDSNGPDVVPVLTGTVVPVSILVLLWHVKPLFSRQSAEPELEAVA